MRRVIVGYLLGVLTIGGCASAFPYRYYATKMEGECYDKGSLLGKEGQWPDIPLAECKPDEVKKLKCITLKDEEFYSLKAGYETCQADLIKCQQGVIP